MCTRYFFVHSSPPLNTVQLFVLKFLVFRENTELIPSGESYELFPVNNYPNEFITLVLVGLSIRNQLDLVEVDNEN